MSNEFEKEEWISGYLDNELTDDQRAEAEKTISQDADASQKLKELKEIGEQIRAIPKKGLGDGFADKVLGAIQAHDFSSKVLSSPAPKIESKMIVESAETSLTSQPDLLELERPIAKTRINWRLAAIAFSTMAALLLVAVFVIPQSIGPDNNEVAQSKVEDQNQKRSLNVNELKKNSSKVNSVIELKKANEETDKDKLKIEKVPAFSQADAKASRVAVDTQIPTGPNGLNALNKMKAKSSSKQDETGRLRALLVESKQPVVSIDTSESIEKILIANGVSFENDKTVLPYAKNLKTINNSIQQRKLPGGKEKDEISKERHQLQVKQASELRKQIAAKANEVEVYFVDTTMAQAAKILTELNAANNLGAFDDETNRFFSDVISASSVLEKSGADRSRAKSKKQQEFSGQRSQTTEEKSLNVAARMQSKDVETLLAIGPVNKYFGLELNIDGKGTEEKRLKLRAMQFAKGSFGGGSAGGIGGAAPNERIARSGSGARKSVPKKAGLKRGENIKSAKRTEKEDSVDKKAIKKEFVEPKKDKYKSGFAGPEEIKKDDSKTESAEGKLDAALGSRRVRFYLIVQPTQLAPKNTETDAKK